MFIFKFFVSLSFLITIPTSVLTILDLNVEEWNLTYNKWEFLYKLSNYTLSGIKKQSKYLKTKYLSNFESGKPVEFLALEFAQDPKQYSEDWQGFKQLCLKQIAEDEQYNYYPQFSRLCYFDFKTSREAEIYGLVNPDQNSEATEFWEIFKFECFSQNNYFPTLKQYCFNLFEERGSVSNLSREIFEHNSENNWYLKNIPTNKKLFQKFVKSGENLDSFDAWMDSQFKIKS